MSAETFSNLIENFGKSIGLAGARPDAEGYCAMSFDDLVVHFQLDEGEVTLFSRIGEVDEDRVEGIYGMLLAANLFWQGTQGATLSVDPDDRLVFIAAVRPIGALNDAAFQSWLGDFVQVADYWQKRLAQANAGGPLYDDEAEPPSNGPDATLMTRV